MRCLNCMQEYDEKYGLCPHCGFIPGTPPKEAYHLHPGVILKNRYIIGTTVGFGGFGITYRAWDTSLDRKVAVKEFYPNGLVNRVPGEKELIIFTGNKANEFENNKKRFLDEARNMTKFSSHPNIVNAYEFFEENNTAYISMEFLEGDSFKGYLKEHGGRADINMAVGVCLSVLDALKEIHAAKIIHRDISPDNVFMIPIPEQPGRYKIKLIDFGAARFSSVEEEKTRSIILKPGYAPVEQYRSKSKQGPFTDIYAVGAMLYRAITGQMPEESVNRAVEDFMLEPKIIVPDLPQYINDAIMRAMALNYELRFQTADQFKDALLNKVKVLGVEEELKKRKTKRILRIAGMAAGVLCCAAGLIGVYMMKQNKLYKLDADISVAMPDVNAERIEKLEAAANYYTAEQLVNEDANSDDVKEINIRDTADMAGSMLSEYTGSFKNVDVTYDNIEAADNYEKFVRSNIGNEDFPQVFETGFIGTGDALMDDLGVLQNTYDGLSEKDYYFFADDAFKEHFSNEKKQIPSSFRAPVLYVNTYLINDESKLESLKHITSLFELEDQDGYANFCVSSDAADMYANAFADSSNFDREFKHSGKYGYEEFLSKETPYFLGTTDDYEIVKTYLGGIYKMIVLEDLQKEGLVNGQFTHVWSIKGDLEGDEKSAADNMVYYIMGETAQRVFNSENRNGLSLNKNMMEKYAENNKEFADIVAALGYLQMDYDAIGGQN